MEGKGRKVLFCLLEAGGFNAVEEPSNERQVRRACLDIITRLGARAGLASTHSQNPSSEKFSSSW